MDKHEALVRKLQIGDTICYGGPRAADRERPIVIWSVIFDDPRDYKRVTINGLYWYMEDVVVLKCARNNNNLNSNE